MSLTRGTKELHGWAQLAFALALSAVLLRVLIPAGTMLAPDPASGELQLVICTQQGLKVITPDAPEDTPDSGSGGHDAVCAFAAPAAHPAPDAARLPSAEPAHTPAPPVRTVLRPREYRAPFAARAPPSPFA